MTKNLFLFFLSMALVLFAAEGVVRKLVPQQLIVLNKDIYRADPEFGWRHKENLDGVINIGEGAVHFATDSHGWRIVPEKKNSSVPAQISVLALGDSFVEALQVDAPFIFTNLLEKKISDSHRPAEVVNTGVAGWGPFHYYLEARKVLAERKFDLGIVFIYIDNDIISERKVDPYRPWYKPAAFRMPRNLSMEELKSSLLGPVNDYLREHSQLFLLLKYRLYPLLHRLGITRDAYHPSFMIYDTGEKNSPRWHVTADICLDIYKEFSKYHVPVIFVLMPAYFQVDEMIFNHYVESLNLPEVSFDPNQPNRLIGEELRTRSLEFLDLLPLLKREKQKGLKIYGDLDKHLNAHGHQIVADAVLPLIQHTSSLRVPQSGTKQ